MSSAVFQCARMGIEAQSTDCSWKSVSCIWWILEEHYTSASSSMKFLGTEDLQAVYPTWLLAQIPTLHTAVWWSCTKPLLLCFKATHLSKTWWKSGSFSWCIHEVIQGGKSQVTLIHPRSLPMSSEWEVVIFMISFLPLSDL